MTEKSRRRVRIAQCSIKGCTNELRRANAYALCLNHLVAVWEFVGEEVLPSELRMNMLFGQMSAKPPERHAPTEDELEARRLAKNAAARKASTTYGHLYVLDTRNELVKIGFTSRELWQRMDQYPPNFRLIVAIAGTRADERDVHRSLVNARAAGREWYNVTPEVVRQINTWISIANTHAAQETARFNEKHASDDHVATARLLPKFTSLEEWPFDESWGMPEKRMPGPKSRLGPNLISR